MILVRDVFQLKFGQAREVKELWQDMAPLRERLGLRHRAMTDFAGPYYTFVLESTYDDMQAYEASLGQHFADSEWRKWYQKLVPHVESGRREIYNVI